MIKQFYLLLYILFLLSCENINTRKSDSESDSSIFLVSYEAEECTYSDYWKVSEYYTGYSLKSDSKTIGARDKTIRFTLDIPKAGDHYVWLLAAVTKYDTTVTNKIGISFEDKQYSVALNPLRALSWRNPETDFPLKITFDAPGKHEIVLEAMNQDGFGIVLDRMIVTDDAKYAPEGYGYSEQAEVILPPAWAFGVLYGGYTNQKETMDRVKKLREGDYPIDAYWIDSWFWDYTGKGKTPGDYIDFEGDLEAYPDMQAMWDYMANNHVKGGIWIWDAIQRHGNEAIFDTFESNGYFKGDTFWNRRGWHNGIDSTLMGNIDYSNPEAVKHWKSLLKPFFDKGVDFFKLDRASHVPYLKAAFEATQEMGKETQGRGYIMSHLHSVYDPKSKLYPAKWTGDAKIAWNQPDYPNTINYAMGAFKENIAMVTDPLRSTYEAPFLGNDTGGYNYFGSDEQSDELYMRWTQFSMLNPITNIFSTYKNETANMPYNFSQEAQENFKTYSHLKMQLFPYNYTYAHLTRETGKKAVRGKNDWDYQYLLGEELLVAPVYEKGAVQREVQFPHGVWFDFYTKDKIQGGQSLTVDAPITQIPLFVKGGSFIPMREYAPTIEEGNNNTLVLHIYPITGEGSFTLYEDDGTSNAYLESAVAKIEFGYIFDEDLTISLGKTAGSFKGMETTRNYKVVIHGLDKSPTKVTLGPQAVDFEISKSRLEFELEKLSKQTIHEVNIDF